MPEQRIGFLLPPSGPSVAQFSDQSERFPLSWNYHVLFPFLRGDPKDRGTMMRRNYTNPPKAAEISVNLQIPAQPDPGGLICR
ncbi:hypothetical protein [uncultured Sneathiella sp.]|uniref:hypothetical protein n=1 Tax=uncultured Sneathiella sp. TaxID=879315 RepID=UPI0030DDD81E